MMNEYGTYYEEEKVFPAIDAAATGRHVYALLQEHGYKPDEVAHIMGYSSQAIYNWKRGVRMPSIDGLDMISALLKVSMNDLVIHIGEDSPGSHQRSTPEIKQAA